MLRQFATLAVLASLGPACDRSPTMPSPPPDPQTQVTPLESSGPVRITFVTASSAPGSTIGGCGPLIEGCVGRLRLTFRLEPPTTGQVLGVRVFLHATNLIACLWTETGPFLLEGGVSRTLEIPFDRADRCGTPTTIATMALVVEGPSQVASRQTWSLTYTFNP
jgi:hypothetical protein